MQMAEWATIWQERTTNLLSRRFLGFILASLLGYFKPETLTYMITLYGMLVAAKVAQEYVRGKQNEGSRKVSSEPV